MTADELRRRYAAGERDFRGARLRNANLCGANLHAADLTYAYLSNADLTDADLRDAKLYGTDLRGAKLTYADLRCADLSNANLRNAKLSHANLPFANLRDADLSHANLPFANLSGADLSDANLSNANLSGADLTGTCLEPETPLPSIPDDEILDAGLEIHGGYVYGWRTARSTVAGDTVYEPGRIYVAQWFSADPETDCHPGIYLAGEEWLRANYPGRSLVRVRCQRGDLLHCYDKWRCRALEVISTECLEGAGDA